MASIESIAAAIVNALSRTREVHTGLGASTHHTEQVRGRLRALGIENKSAEVSSIASDLETARAQTLAIERRLEAALAAIRAAQERSGRGLASAAQGARSSSPPLPSNPPDFSKASIPEGKLKRYALNPDHPTGRHKARVIKSRTGFGPEDADEVHEQILEKAPFGKAERGSIDEHGARWHVDVDLQGPTGGMKIRTAWITRPDDTTSLTTISFPPKGRP